MQLVEWGGGHHFLDGDCEEGGREGGRETAGKGDRCRVRGLEKIDRHVVLDLVFLFCSALCMRRALPPYLSKQVRDLALVGNSLVGGLIGVCMYISISPILLISVQNFPPHSTTIPLKKKTENDISQLHHILQPIHQPQREIFS